MEPDAVISLFDSFWFQPRFHVCSSIPKVSQQLTNLSRSKSEDLSDPVSNFPKPNLESQKEFRDEIPKVNKRKKNQKQRKVGSKSLSELEFEELKGFMDLGFVFSQEDRGDSSLVKIIPGLQRLGEEEVSNREINGEEESRRRRPYLSEAWVEEEEPLIQWRVPVSVSTVGNEVAIKDSLKWWAHSVASAVR